MSPRLGEAPSRALQLQSLKRLLIPPGMREWARLVSVERRFPHAGNIATPDVAAGAILGRGVSLAQGVVVNGGVCIGDYSYVQRGAMLTSAHIGRFCSIGHYAVVGPENHATDHLSTYPGLYRGWLLGTQDAGWKELPAPPQIGSDVWIGAHTVLVQGVTVGHGAVIAAGAVVTGNVQPYSVVGGVPARVIRPRFEQATIDALLADPWWDLSLDDLRARFGDQIEAGSGWRGRSVAGE